MTHWATPHNFGLAVQHHRAGRLQEAERIFAQICAAEPGHVDSWLMLGFIALQTGRNDAAVDWIRKAIALKPGDPQAHNNLGNALKSLGRLDDAIGAYRRAAVLNPGLAEVQSNLGTALSAGGRWEEAVVAFRRAVELQPNVGELHFNLANVLNDMKEFDAAIAAYRQSLALKPNLPEAHCNMGNALKGKGRMNDAVESWQRAIALKPNYPEAFYNIGDALVAAEKHDAAMAANRQAIALKPDYFQAHNNLGVSLLAKGLLDEAVAAFRRAIALNPGYVESHNNLGATLSEMGQLDEAVAACRQALALNPAESAAVNNLLFALYHHPESDSLQLLQESRRWAEQQRAFAPSRSANPDRSPDRKLKVAYLSPLSVISGDAHFILPLLTHHDRERFEIYYFASKKHPRELIERLRSQCDRWVEIHQLSTQEAVEAIHGHDIDILVNISKPADDCLKIFANRIAPVQVIWLAFASGTTGLGTADYRISDPFVDPPELDGQYYSEKTVRLPETAWCFDPLTDAQPIQPLPAPGNGFVTFGSLNRSCKINALVTAAWAEILRSMPRSRLHVLAVSGSTRARLLDQFRQHRVESERIEFIDRCSRLEYLRQYGRIDIMLDTFPYGGHTTAFDSLWMGVPVVTCAGRTCVGRVAASALKNLQLDEFVGQTPAQYAQIAVSLANDLPRLTDLRSSLRQRIEGSPLMDGSRFARQMEAAYRAMAAAATPALQSAVI